MKLRKVKKKIKYYQKHPDKIQDRRISLSSNVSIEGKDGGTIVYRWQLN